MAAYVIANIEVIDPVVYEDYRKGVSATIAAHGGRYLARGGAIEVLEGEFDVKRFVVIEFPDVAAIRAWYASPEYQPLLRLRQRTSKGMLMIVQGL
ncbi:MAG TPA: DUF1330 domain-containing protein [Casimicrobiaceae bacterium]|jgi:uncharacterized protein (DUF1330 family)